MNSTLWKARGSRTVLALGTLTVFALMALSAEPKRVAPPGFASANTAIPGHAHNTLRSQSDDQLHRKSAGCIHCHQHTHDPHFKETVRLGCVDCHGGNANTLVKECAHVAPRYPEAWRSSGNPVRSYTLLNHESPEFIQFVNPGDLRIAHITCGACHANEVLQVKKGMMTHGAMLWGAALYNNGAVPNKWARYGESYGMNGVPQRMQTVPPPTQDEIDRKGVLPFLDPLPRFEMSQPGNILRTFERGGRFRAEIGLPERLEESGRPRARLSVRGLGTENRTDPVFIGLQKTRFLDPTLNFLGTNDHPGDYRSSGCTACHMIYANDRSEVNSSRKYAKYGHMGQSFSADPMIPKNESGHPIDHKFTRAIPTSQCIVCHVHPGTNVMNSYPGFMWWDNETDGELMYPARQKYPTAEEMAQAAMSNPDEAAARGLWSDPEFLARVSQLNGAARHTQFGDFHGHGWVFRAVFKKDRKGNMLDHRGCVIYPLGNTQLQAAMTPPSDDERRHGKQRDGVPVHMMDIHLEKGMHCIDCHFVQDVHGNTKLYGEVRAAIEIQCVDCHGTASQKATLKTTGPAAEGGGRNLEALRTPFGKRRFERRGDKLIQNSMVEENLWWEVVQTADTIDTKHARYNERSHLAKTVRFEGDQMVWGDLPGGDKPRRSLDERHSSNERGGPPDERRGSSPPCAHANERMSCIACHSAWNPSCFGCHLPQKANQKTPQLHNEGDITRNAVAYNFQTLRDDVYMLARDGNVTGNRIGPARSSCAVHVGSYNQNRESIYVQQQTISGGGMSGIAFSTNVPHTVRGGTPLKTDGRSEWCAHLPGRSETKSCTDCHVSKQDDNNAIMAQLLMHGTNYVNFIGRYCWVAAGEHGLAAAVVTERDEPQAVIGSSLHRLAFPDFFQKHLKRERELDHIHEHPGKDVGDNLKRPFRKSEVLSVQARGEFLYAACGEGGMRVFDIAFIDHKGFSERITTAPVSPVGQQLYVPTKYCTCVAAPTTIAPDPTRVQFRENYEQPVHALYGYIFIGDRYEGLITVPAATLLDGNPTNNFLQRELTFNPDGVLNGTRSITIVGLYAYVCCEAGLVVISLEDPKCPRVTQVLPYGFLKGPRNVQVQFRYAYVCDMEGVKVLDVTDLANPRPVSALPLADARSLYVARTYAYVAAGHQGLVILDIEKPETPEIDQVYDAEGEINDVNDVKLGITYTSEFAYLADGKNGLRVVQLTSPETPGNAGFSPRPTPTLIATAKMPHKGHALFVSKGLDRDRAVDESGNQIAVFGRVGARPLNLEEQRRLFRRNGNVWKVSDDPRDGVYRYVGPPRPGK